MPALERVLVVGDACVDVYSPAGLCGLCETSRLTISTGEAHVAQGVAQDDQLS